jgi:hypothetical protein
MEWLKNHMLGSAAFIDFDDATNFYTCSMLELMETTRGALVICPQQQAGAVDPPNLPPQTACVLLGVGNIAAGRDPGTSDDSTTGVSVGFIWFNNAGGQLRSWMCRDNTQGAAKWTYEGADYANGGTNPSAEVTQAGSSTASIAAEGNIFRSVVAAPGTNTGANGSDIILALWTLPANAFDGLAGTNRGITITAQGSFGGTGNNKDCKIIIGASGGTVGGVVGGGGTTIADTGVVSTNGGGWSIQANVFKYGAVGSNTQLGIHQQSQCGSVVQALLAPQNLVLVENAPILIAVTGRTTTLTNDIAFNFGEVNFMN